MYPPVFAAVNVTGVHALLKTGQGELRFYLFGEAPQGVTRPYAVWRQVFGLPENFLGEAPDLDTFGTQIDVYANDAASARAVAAALRDAIEPVAHITSWRGDGTDPETKAKTFTFEAEWKTAR